jgi:hypothetical protein
MWDLVGVEKRAAKIHQVEVHVVDSRAAEIGAAEVRLADFFRALEILLVPVIGLKTGSTSLATDGTPDRSAPR